jgi:hypothetical protein
MKKRTKKTVSRVISWVLAALFLVGISLLGLSGLGSIHAKACNFELDEGVAWVDGRTYYMPGELLIEDPEGSKWVAFRGSNGMVYEYDHDVFGDDLEDAPYLLTMDSKGTKEWYDDEILVIWRSVL